jgi:hypothetical protein
VSSDDPTTDDVRLPDGDRLPPEPGGEARGKDWAGLTERRRFIAERLNEQSPRLSEWYVSAVTVVRERRPAAWMPVLGHLCRDLMNGAPRHFNLPIAPRVEYDKWVTRLDSALGEPLGETPTLLTPEAWEALRALLGEHRELTERLAPERLFAAAGRPATGSETARRELDRAWRETQKFFLSITHIRDPSQPDADAAEVIGWFAVLEDLLAAQLRAVPYWSLDMELQEIAALEQPIRADLERAARLWRGDAETQFFETLTSPGWVPLLVAAGYLDAPPAPERVDGGVRLPFWPVSRYLARVAGAAPADVMAAIEKLASTDNGRVHADLVEAAVAMPAADGAKAVRRVVAWLDRPWGSFAAENAVQLVKQLAHGGEIKAALKLASKLMSFNVAATPRDRPFGPGIDYVTVFHGDWEYRQATGELVPTLVAVDGPAAVAMLARILAGVLRRERRLRAEEGPENDSWMWRKAIADHAQDSVRDDPRHLLISALRDAAVEAVNGDTYRSASMLALLDNYDHLIFERVIMHLVRAADAPALVDRRRGLLLDRGRFESIKYRNEYYQLARDRFGELEAADRATVLGWIEEGPNLEDWMTRYDGEPSQEEIVERADYWRYERLHPLVAHLDGDWKERYDKLRLRFGDLVDPDVVGAVRVGWGQPSARYSVADLRAMDTDELIETLINYKPQAGVFPPESEDSLAMVVSAAVAEEPGHWAPLLAGLVDRLPIRHLQAALDGCWQVGRDGKLRDWEGAIALCEIALDRADKPRCEPSADVDKAIASEGERGRTVHSVIRVVETAVRGGEHPVAPVLTPRMLALLERLADDPDPTPATDNAHADEPFHGALNGIRSRAMDAAIAFAQGLHPDAPYIDRPAMVHVAEIQQLLEDHLDVDKEPSPSVRAVYGARLGHLFFLDEGWTAERLDVIFDPTQPDVAAAAWRGYVLNAHLAPRVLAHVVGAGLYDGPVDELSVAQDQDSEEREARDARDRLVEHVGLAWCRGVAGSDMLLNRLFSKATGKDRAELVTWIGLSVLHHEDATELAAEVAPRLPDLWGRRLDELGPRGGDPELVRYGWWYSSGKLTEPEGTELLVRTLTAAKGRVTDLRGCLERATEVASENPSGACAVLAAVVAGEGRDELRVVGNRVRELLEAIVAARDTDAGTRGEAERLVNELGEHGLGDYRDALSPEPPAGGAQTPP